MNNETFLSRKMRYRTVYVDKRKMQEEVINSLEKGRMTEELGRMLNTLVDNLIHSSMFDFRASQEDMFNEFRASTVLHCVDKFYKKYDAKRSTAFAFFTTTAINHLTDLFKALGKGDYLGEYRGIVKHSHDMRTREKAVVMYIEDVGSQKLS